MDIRPVRSTLSVEIYANVLFGQRANAPGRDLPRSGGEDLCRWPYLTVAAADPGNGPHSLGAEQVEISSDLLTYP